MCLLLLLPFSGMNGIPTYLSGQLISSTNPTHRIPDQETAKLTIISEMLIESDVISFLFIHISMHVNVWYSLVEFYCIFIRNSF